jgi:hypothetical protein
VELTKLRALDLDVADWHQITWRNACRLLGEPEIIPAPIEWR